MQISVETPPLDVDLTEELIDFWDGIFGDGYQPDRSLYAGDERSFNRDTFYLLEQGGRTVGSSHLTTAVGNSELSGLGEVGTAPQCRGKGIASRLCRAARDDFLAAGGQALFLGTVNPVAARIYHRLGWRKMPGSTIWALIASGESPESFLVDYFRASDEVGVEPGSPAQRVPMIPLIIAPHDWRVLDANVELYSTRYLEQNSCMGLYPRYAKLVEQCAGAWFAARTRDGRLVGLASARPDGEGACQVDGFVHGRYAGSWVDLMRAAIDWAGGRCWVRVCVEDEEKGACLKDLGFVDGGPSEPFVMGDRTVEAVRLVAGV